MTEQASPGWYLRPGEIRPTGWLRTELERDLDGLVGRFPRICTEASSDIFVSGRVSDTVAATGRQRPGDKRHWWNGETEGKWIDGFTRLAHVLGHEPALQEVDAYVRRILDHQDPDGYVGIYGADTRASGLSCVGDLWTQTFVFLTLLAHYDATRDPSVLEATTRAAAATIALHGPGGQDHPFVGSDEDSMVLGHNLLIVEPMLWLHQLTGEQRFLDFALYCYAEYSRADLGWPESDGQEARMRDPDVPFVGHGAHTCAQLRVPLLLYGATGDPRFRDAYETGFRKLTEVTGVSGACKSDECIGMPDDPGVALPEAGYEHCAVTELLHSLHHAVAVTGDMSYADRAEWLLFNAAHALRQPDGRAVAYFGADNQYAASQAMGTRWDYSPTHDDIAVCCAPSAARVLAHHTSRMVLATGEPGLLVAFYGPVSVRTSVAGTPVSVEMTTDYPFDQEVTITVTADRPVRFPVHLRVPGWSTGVEVRAGAARVSHGDRLCTVEAEWGTTASVVVRFAAEVRLAKGVDGTVGVQRGPLLFARDIPAIGTPTRDYAVEGFADIDYRPAAGSEWQYALRVDPDQPSAAFAVEERAAGGLPWSDSPVVLWTRALSPTTSEHYYTDMVRDLELVPIGCTRLRRTTFPWVTAGRARPADRARHPTRDSNP